MKTIPPRAQATRLIMRKHIFDDQTLTALNITVAVIVNFFLFSQLLWICQTKVGNLKSVWAFGVVRSLWDGWCMSTFQNECSSLFCAFVHFRSDLIGQDLQWKNQILFYRQTFGQLIVTFMEEEINYCEKHTESRQQFWCKIIELLIRDSSESLTESEIMHFDINEDIALTVKSLVQRLHKFLLLNFK